MRVCCVVLLAIAQSIKECTCPHVFEYAVATTLKHLNDIENVAALGDAHHREDKWVSYTSSETEEGDLKTTDEVSSSMSDSYSVSSSQSSEASTAETTEVRRATEKYRACNACPHDLMKKHTNRGIKWICGAYQRARRSFKSECMMRYRNCQDGTLFVKIHDRKCKDHDKYHGRHWFYVYKT